jgi:3-oxoacyl-[acyl-carrier protein] reductase
MQKKSKAVADAINAAGGQAISVPGDVTDKKFPQRLIDETIKAFGKINILINNAGYTWDGMVHKMTDDQWDAMLLVHNTAPFRIVRAAAPYLRDAGKAEMDAGKAPENRCIINISSTSGLHGNTGQANYSTAKMGVVGFTKTLAKEWGSFGVRCNGIAYGWIETRLTADKNKGAFMQVGDKKVALGIPGADQRGATGATGNIPLKRSGKVHEAAGAMLILACPHASYITGHTLEVTGGAGI